MSNEQLFALYFGGICSIRFHPKNIGVCNPKDKVILTVDEAARVADIMLREHRRRFPCPSGAALPPRV